MDNLAESLIDKQWNMIKISGRNFLFKCRFETDDYELLVFDLSSFLIYYSYQNEIETFSEELNPKKTIPKEKILKCLSSCLTETRENCKFTIATDTKEKIVFELETKINESVGFKWKFEFKSVEKTHIKHHLVVPLLFCLSEKTSRENELLEIIKNKDKLIEDYKSQGVKSNLKHISSEPFCSVQFDEILNKKSEERREKFFDNPELYLTLETNRKLNEIYVEQFTARKRKLEAETALANNQNVNDLNSKKQKVKLKKSESESETSSTHKNELLDKQLENERLKAEKKANKLKKPPLKL